MASRIGGPRIMTKYDSNIALGKPWPTLYHKGSSGKMYQWQVWTEGADIVTEHGQVDGKLQIARKTATPKNVGKANETTPEAQAQLEAEAMYKHKLERKYCLSIRECEGPLFLPMLAHSFEKKKKKVEYPVWVQPKLDGVRCIARWKPTGAPEIELLTRAGKQWDIPHLKQEIAAILPLGMVLDGEIYIHGKTFQDISKLVKKQRPESADLEYHIYDVPVYEDNMDLPFIKRLSVLGAVTQQIKDIVPSQTSHLRVVPTRIAKSEEEVYEVQSECLEYGFEGAIVRLPNGVYKFGYRSSDLLKVKTFHDDEYEVVGYHAGVGKFETCVIWECVTADGQPFNCVPQGSFEQRQEWLDTADEYVGKLLKVKYFELTDDGIPRFPVGIGFRLSEDL